ncbi:hypothetical protein MGYG_08995 [Nannizzia gypsea CBS 118893]|uniref:Uncharacterized protein n=1 Tax=Arthroderma gypseum (strain ATCC MYA-4604 / CBS 118893) TaxID=535722 RepID=E4UNW3_ARTGP|nr:hypothetical protein MGYG_08995 [Nannizzia gypsea CBS 118893]EFQ99716.1 hypothetical protein MGYG_08995 [Nannizzia gypsea CBS 118893]
MSVRLILHKLQAASSIPSIRGCDVMCDRPGCALQYCTDSLSVYDMYSKLSNLGVLEGRWVGGKGTIGALTGAIAAFGAEEPHSKDVGDVGNGGIISIYSRKTKPEERKHVQKGERGIVSIFEERKPVKEKEECGDEGFKQ